MMRLPAFPERLKRVLPLIFAVVMGLMAVVLVNRYLTQQRAILAAERQRLMANYTEPIEVLVASHDLPEGTTLEIDHLKMASVPERFAQPYVARSPDQVVGKVTMVPVAEGEQIMLSKLRQMESVPVGSILSTVTPKGKRAVTITVDAITGVGGFVRPGDLVDVLWTIPVPQPAGQPAQVVTLTLFQDVPVLAVGSTMVGGAGAEQTTEASPFNVTLGLTPQDTAFLLFARDQGGRMQLSLRPRNETGQVAVTPANINTLTVMALGMQPEEGPQHKESRQVEVYKGLKRDVVVLPVE